jgi:hypothetical protein
MFGGAKTGTESSEPPEIDEVSPIDAIDAGQFGSRNDLYVERVRLENMQIR